MAFLTRRVGLAIVSALIGALAFGSQGPSPAFAQGRDVVVFAAASMKNALDEINQAVAQERGQEGDAKSGPLVFLTRP